MFRLLNSVSSKKAAKKAIKSQKGQFLKAQYRRFYLFVGLATALPLVLISSINYLIDPYDYFNTPDFLKINFSKPKKDFNDRLFKSADIIRIKPITVILGSSRTKQGINPEYSALLNVQPAYNLALNGPNFYEVRRYLEHAIANQKKIEQVILGIDFFMFNDKLKNQPSFSESRLEKQHFIISDVINSLLSLDTLAASQATIQASQKNKNNDAHYGENGFMPHRKVDDGTTKSRFNYSIGLFFNLHSDYIYSEKYFSEFKKLIQLCQENNIKLFVFIPPSHATDMEAIRVIGQWETFENWKREMTKLIPVWDFSGYNSITTEKIRDRMANYADNSHFTTSIGDLILDRLFSYNLTAVPSDFGILMTPENIEAHLGKIRDDRKIWLKQHPDEERLVLEIKEKADREQKQD